MDGWPGLAYQGGGGGQSINRPSSAQLSSTPTITFSSLYYGVQIQAFSQFYQLEIGNWKYGTSNAIKAIFLLLFFPT